MARITKKEVTMIEQANKYLFDHAIKDVDNESYMIAESMLMSTDSFRGYSFVDESGNKTSRDMAHSIQFTIFKN